MSQKIANDHVLFEQRKLAAAGFYHGPLDGRWTAALDRASTGLDAAAAALKAELGSFDPKSELSIATLLPKAQRLARRFMQVASGFPLAVRIISGTRTYAEQNVLFAQTPKVTNAKGGQSNHNFSIAWDVGIFDTAGNYFTGATAKQAKAYADLATLIKANVPGLEWGGDWASFKDPPHYQLATGRSLKDVRALFESGKPYV